MAVHNDSGYYYLDSHKNDQGLLYTWRDKPPQIYTMRNFSDGWNYYYMEFKDDISIKSTPVSNLIPPEIFSSIKSPDSRTLLILNNSHEAFLSVVEPIYKHVIIEQGIPAHKIVLMTGSFDITEEIERVRWIYKLPSIKAEIDMCFEEQAHSMYHAMIHPEVDTWNPPNTLHDGPYKKKFLNFNRRWRLHRPTFVMLLKKYGLLDQGFVSLAHSDDDQDWKIAWDHIVDMHAQFPRILDIAHELKSELLAMPDLYLDTQDLVTNRAPLTLDHNYLYEQSLFSIVSETHYYVSHLGYESTRFLSEKVWKPILFKHPFIVISSPGILKCMKYIGYKTFDGIIDESYDKITNDGDRLLAIAEEANRICNMTPAQTEKFIKQCREVCEYNYNTILNKTQFYHKLNYK